MEIPNKVDNQILITLATQFRKAIENTPNLDIPLDQFPKGACGTTCDLLAEWLWEHGIESSYYCGKRSNGGYTHAWLEVEGFIIDITGDQFPEFPKAVYVGPLTPFHVQFCLPQVERDMINGFHCYDDRTISRLEREYKKIINNVSLSE
ncbi:MAG: hypothetical protein IJI45_19460 [Anaerolineaceae bacterium]|nr:hypothetical protein [Anaerolineaceae bacterium]